MNRLVLSALVLVTACADGSRVAEPVPEVRGSWSVRRFQVDSEGCGASELVQRFGIEFCRTTVRWEGARA